MAEAASKRALESVSDTALLVAHHRAMESARADALFKDPYAQRLAGERGAEITRKLRWGARMAWSTVTRTVLLDDVVLRLIGEGLDTVLNLAAGLDTRPYRLELPSTLRWIEIDLPAMTAAKSELMKGETPRCQLQRVSADLANAMERERLLAEYAGKSKKALVMTEGLLVYLNEQIVSELAGDLYQQAAIQYWALDLASPMVVKRMQKLWGKHMKAANTWMAFGPAEGTKFFEPLGWREREFHDLYSNCKRINRPMPMMWMIEAQARLFPKLTAKRMQQWRSGVVLLERQ